MKLHRMAWPALAVLLMAGDAAAQGNAARGRQRAEREGCIACHTIDDSAGDRAAPYIAGQKVYYLTKQILALRRTQRPLPASSTKLNERIHPNMGNQVAPLSDAEIVDLAEYFASLPCVFRRFAVSARVEPPPAAQRCAYCHGASGNNRLDIVPNLAGQKKDYLATQLWALRQSALDIGTSAPAQRFHRMMAPSAFDLTDTDITQLANYFSAQSCRAAN